MLRSELGKELPDGSSLPAACLIEPLADALADIGSRGDIEQTLIVRSVLFDGRHYGPLVDVFRYVRHEVRYKE
jgi:hypothetical protein